MTASDPATRVGPIHAVGIVGRAGSENADDAVHEAVAFLRQRDVETVIDADTATRVGIGGDGVRTCDRDALPGRVDLLVVLGGDGTLLSVAHPIATAAPDTPVLAVNCGSLGFLTEIRRQEMGDALASILDGQAGLDERRMLHAQVVRDDVVIADRTVLNDVVVGKSARSNIMDFTISVRDHLVATGRADGVIIATPTGSTAYNLAAGGPIVHPTVDAVIVTPIAPHTLTNRPIVMSDTAPITIAPHVADDRLHASASFDGQVSIELGQGDVVNVERATTPLRVVRAESRNYFAVLLEKLKWGEP